MRRFLAIVIAVPILLIVLILGVLEIASQTVENAVDHFRGFFKGRHNFDTRSRIGS
jgi:hypothetical protein